MNLSDNYNVASRYRTIRKHLDSLGYRQALSLDALPLIEKLLADLIQTTDSLKHFKAVAQDSIEACSELQLSIDPYKCDNARLVQECNRLHLELIDEKEARQKEAKDLKKKVHNLESECSNLQLSSSRNLKRIKELETESAQKSKKIQELLGKCCKPLISNAALASKKRACYPLRRPSLESEPLPKSKGNLLPSLSKVQPSTVDLLAMADRKMNTLNHEVITLEEELSMQVDNVYALKAQLAVKDKEIVRLRKMLEGGRPHSAVSKDCSCRKIDHYKEHNVHENNSNIHTVCCKGSEINELRKLQQSKLDFEQQLREALEKQHDAMSQAMKLAERNEELEKELRDIDHIALAVEADCNSAVKENNKRVSNLQEKLESVMTQVHVLEGELMMERRSGQELRADLEAGRLENRNLHRKLECTLEEKKKLTDRINELTVIEQNLKTEIQKLSRDNGNLKLEVTCLEKKMHNNEKPPVVVSEENKEKSKKIKEKSQKNDKNKGKALTKKKVSASGGQRRSLSPPVHEKAPDVTRLQAASKDDEVIRDTNGKNCRQLFIEKDSRISQLQSTIDQIQTDRDYYKNEYNRLREQCAKNSGQDNQAEMWGQICELRRQLIEKEHSIVELQREKKELCREKFELELQLQSAKAERRNTCHLCNQNSTTDSKAMLERVERERDAARADVDRLMQERDALCERLKGNQRATIGNLEDQMEDLREELRRTKQELSTQRTQYYQLRTLQDQADQALGDVQNQLGQTETELYKTMDRNRLLEQQRLQLDNELKSLRQELNTARGNASRTDQEKDQIVMQLNEKNDKIALLERELAAKEQEITSVEQQLQQLQQKNQICVDQSAEQERRLRNLQMEMEMNQRQLAAASNDRDNAAQENRRLQDDLAALTCEIRTLQRELETSRAESYDLKKQLQTYVSEVRRAEELINRKENERTEMLNHFRSLSLEATMLENNNHSLESEAAEARSALQSARDRSLDLERQLTDKDCMMRGYETQISELTQTVASLESQVRQQMEQRQRAEADLNAVRDLCVKLDQQKEALVKELGDKDAMKAHYEAQLARLKAEQNMVQDQINRDHVTVERLETLLDQARQESIDSQTANQQLQCEITRCKQKMCDLQTKLSNESAELRRYQNQAAEYSKQVSELRRQVTNERFDRAKKDEEQRRMCLCGESNKSRTENFTSDSMQGSAQTRRLDCSSINVQSTPPPRCEKNESAEEYRLRRDMRSEARRTNRFDTNDTSKSPPIVVCKCAENNGKMYNDSKPRSSARDNARRTDVNLHPDIIGGQQADEKAEADDRVAFGSERAHNRVTDSNCGSLCVQARLEEDKDRKDIRVRIFDSSTCSHLDIENKKSVFKVCTPLRNDSRQRDPLLESETSQPRRLEKTTSTDDDTVEEKETYEAEGSTKVLEQPRNVDRAMRKQTSLENRTSRTLEERSSQSLEEAQENLVWETLKFCCPLGSVNKNMKIPHEAMNTIRRTIDEMSASRPRERSRSVPVTRSNAGSLSQLRSNSSFPTRVDHSETAITAEDLTRPEFVRILTELKEQTKNVEKELSRINESMRKKGNNEHSVDLSKPTKHGSKVRISYEKADGRSSSKNFTPIATSTTNEPPRGKKNRNEPSHIDSFKDEEKSNSGLMCSKKFGLDSNKKQGKPEAKPSGGKLRVSKNQIVVVETTDSECTGAQTSLDDSTESSMIPSTADQSTLAKPSKIHRLIGKTGRPTSRRQNIVDDYEKSRPRGSLRGGGSSREFCTKSRIPKRQGSPERIRNPENYSNTDFRLIAPPTTPVNEMETYRVDEVSHIPLRKERSPSRMNRYSHRARSTGWRDDQFSVEDDVVFRGTNEHCDRGKARTTQIIKIDRTYTTPKPFSVKTSSKKLTNVADLRDRHSQMRTFPRTETSDSTYEKLFARHTYGSEYLTNDMENGRRNGLHPSRNPCSRKRTSQEKLSLTHYSPDSNRLELIGTVKPVEKSKRGNNSIEGKNKESRFQQRSRSDPRESRNSRERTF